MPITITVVQEPVLEFLLPELDYGDIKQVMTINTRFNSTILNSRIFTKILEDKGLDYLLKWIQQISRSYYNNITLINTLDLTLNKLEKIPPEIGLLSSNLNLKYLYLNHNNLKEVPPEIGQLSCLESLWLRNNKLEKIPSEIGKISSLKMLCLCNNNLKEIPSEIGLIFSLEKLWLSDNKLILIPQTLFNRNDVYIDDRYLRYQCNWGCLIQ